MFVRIVQIVSVATFAAVMSIFASAVISAESNKPAVPPDGIVKVKSAYAFDETVARLKQDVTAKGITFFMAVEQSKLAAAANIKLRPSTLLIFGNPALGSHFITARAEAGLDWPVRLLVTQDDQGQVWAAYTDFDWIARRHGITNRAAEFGMASKVIGSVTSSVTAK
jgi:uncharacterized protein (DUF302 family)